VIVNRKVDQFARRRVDHPETISLPVLATMRPGRKTGFCRPSAAALAIAALLFTRHKARVFEATLVVFLERAKREADVLLLLLESDAGVRDRKGARRPVNSQADRARVLAALRPVDYVLVLPHLRTDAEYDELVRAIRPDVIATTGGDPEQRHKERQAASTGARLTVVLQKVEGRSSTRIIDAARLCEDRV
jgi:D-glycero-beta-D-manno-heptose 1-phosphate adenylyltransferase